MSVLDRYSGTRTGTKKVFTGGGIGGAVSVIVVWAIKAFGDVEVPPEVAAAFGVFVTTIAGYFTPPRRQTSEEKQ